MAKATKRTEVNGVTKDKKAVVMLATERAINHANHRGLIGIGTNIGLAFELGKPCCLGVFQLVAFL